MEKLGYRFGRSQPSTRSLAANRKVFFVSLLIGWIIGAACPDMRDTLPRFSGQSARGDGAACPAIADKPLSR